MIDYLRDVLKAYGKWRLESKQAILEYLERFQISNKIYCPFSWLSRGQTYKVALTALLVAQPELWLLDEPFASGLDGLGMDVLRREMHAALQNGSSIIYSTQILEIAQSLDTRIAILDRGRLQALGTMEQLQNTSSCSGGLLEIMKRLTDKS